jgi:TolB-like protein
MADRIEADNPPETTNTAQAASVFISYASRDAAVATAVVEALERSGIPCWVAPRDVAPGTFYGDEIVHAIDATKASVLILSQNAAASQHVLREVERAASKRHPVVSLRIDQAALPAGLEYFLNTSQWLDASGMGVERALPRLVDGVQRVIASPGRAGVPQPPAAGPPQQTSVSKHASRGPRFLALGLGVLGMLGLAYFAVDKLWVAKRSATEQPWTATTNTSDKSIAVLPFADMSEKKDQEYFADGMAEEILDILAKIPRLTVVGRTSSFQFKGRTEDLRKIGEKLGAAYVVEGSVRKAGDRIRVTAQLIDTQSGNHLWSQSYDKDYGNVLTLQDEIATAIARALQLTVGARDARPLRDEHATEAYTLYLRGRLALDMFGASSLLEAQSAFQQALQLDPTLLPAAEGLALTYLNRGLNENDISGREAWEQARSAARKALQISANSSSAHGVLGYVAGMQDFDWTTAETEFRTALALNPNDVDTLTNAAALAAMHGDIDQAMRRINTSLVLDPLNPNTHQVRGMILYLTHDYSAAEAALQKSIAINPEIDGSHLTLAYIHLVNSRWEAALKEFTADPESSSKDIGLALVDHALGKKKESDAALARVVEEVGSIWAYGIGCIHAYRGERDQAFEWLEKSRAARDGDLFFVRGEPLLAPLHDDPRWAALMKSMNLPN